MADLQSLDAGITRLEGIVLPELVKPFRDIRKKL